MRYKILIVISIISLSLGAGLSTALFFAMPDQVNTQNVSIEPATKNMIIIDKRRKKLFLYKNDKEFVYPIATGKNSGDKQKVGDCRTPIGTFHIVSMEPSADWSYDFEDDNLGPIVGAYGPWFLRFDGPWEGIAIHGTHDPASMGKNATHGCIRMRNKDLIELKDKISVGYTVYVRE